MKKKVIKYEYKIREIEKTDDSGFILDLNSHGNHGWELIQIVNYKSKSNTGVFKRKTK